MRALGDVALPLRLTHRPQHFVQASRSLDQCPHPCAVRTSRAAIHRVTAHYVDGQLNSLHSAPRVFVCGGRGTLSAARPIARAAMLQRASYGSQQHAHLLNVTAVSVANTYFVHPVLCNCPSMAFLHDDLQVLAGTVVNIRMNFLVVQRDAVRCINLQKL